ncbi:MAG: hypothetical protein ACKOJI_11720 [Phycisphaerales bacterium]
MNAHPTIHRLARPLAALAVAAAAALGTARPAEAQAGRRMLFAEAFRPDIMQRDLSLMAQQLQLEEWQRPVIEALINDYTTAFNTGVDAMKDRMRAASENAVRSGTTGGDQVLQKVLEPLGSWRTEKEQMLAKFTADVKSQLGAQQLELWPKFERALRRERLLPEGDLSGERVDLFAVVARMQPTPAEEEATAPVLAQYEVALDQALAARSQRSKEVLPRLEAAMSAMDYEKMGDLQDQVMQASVAVRDANDAAIESIAAAMGARGPEFRKAALEDGYADVYRIHPVMVLMQQVRKLPSLSPEQVAQVDALMQEFAGACDQANAKLAAVVKSEEPKAAKRRARAMMERKAGAPASAPGTKTDDEVAKARAEKEAMGQPYRERLMAILGPEQLAEINGPSPEETEREKLRLMADPKGLGPKAQDEGGGDGVEPNPTNPSGADAPPPPTKIRPDDRSQGGQRRKTADPAGPPAGGGEPR